MILKTIMRSALYAAFLLGLCSSAYAGQLFPPQNAPQGTAACPNGQVLKWTGATVICQDPTPGVTFVPCEEGYALQSVTNGVATCVDIRPYTAGKYQWAESGFCRYVNPLTGDCTCPEGYSPVQSWEFHNSDCIGGFYWGKGNWRENPSCSVTEYTCYRGAGEPTVSPSGPVRQEPIEPYPYGEEPVQEPIEPYPLEPTLQQDPQEPYPAGSPVQAEPIEPYPVGTPAQAEPIEPYPANEEPKQEPIEPYPVGTPAQAEPIEPYPANEEPRQEPAEIYPANEEPVKEIYPY